MPVPAVTVTAGTPPERGSGGVQAQAPRLARPSWGVNHREPPRLGRGARLNAMGSGVSGSRAIGETVLQHEAPCAPWPSVVNIFLVIDDVSAEGLNHGGPQRATEIGVDARLETARSPESPISNLESPPPILHSPKRPRPGTHLERRVRGGSLMEMSSGRVPAIAMIRRRGCDCDARPPHHRPARRDHRDRERHHPRRSRAS